MWVFGLELVLWSGKQMVGGQLVLRARVPTPESAGVIRLILPATSGQNWGTPRSCRLPRLTAAGRHEAAALGRLRENGLARNLDGLTVSGTPVYNTRARWSLFILL